MPQISRRVGLRGVMVNLLLNQWSQCEARADRVAMFIIPRFIPESRLLDFMRRTTITRNDAASHELE